MKKWLLLFSILFTTLAAQANPLPAAEVFQMKVHQVDPNTFIAEWQIKEHYFLYSDRIKLTSPKDTYFNLGPLRLPPTVTKTDKRGHVDTIYRKQLSLPISVLGIHPGEALIKIHYQGCSDDGFCYPPETKEIKLQINEQLALSDASIEADHRIGSIDSSTAFRLQDRISQVFSCHNWLMIFLLFYGFGLLLSFTPCILPMVPVLSGIIVGHSETLTTKKAFLLSLSYVLSMSLTYAAIGGTVALVGANIQISMQSPWAISLFSLLFLLLAFSMFGFYELKLPNAWQSKIAGTSRNHRRGHYWGAAVMGCLSTLILSPCVTAPLIGALTYIAQTGRVLAGSMALFFLGLGMGTPLLLIGTSAGKWLPTAGSWMNTIKALFGVLFIAIALYLMARIVPASLTMLLWACLLIFSGIYAGALTLAANNKEKFCQGIGIILLGYGLLILIGASMGSTNPLQPLNKLHTTTLDSKGAKQEYSLAHLKQTIADSKGRPIMLDFYADWCASCKMMEATTFQNSQIRDMLHSFTVIKIDLSHYTKQDKAVMDYFKVIAPPTFIFFDSQGQEIGSLRAVGEHSTIEFLSILKEANK